MCVCVWGGGGGGGGVAKFIILGGPNSQQAHDIIVMSIRQTSWSDFYPSLALAFIFFENSNGTSQQLPGH